MQSLDADLQGGSKQHVWAELVVLELVHGCCAALITGMAEKTALHYSYRKRLPGIELEGLWAFSHELEVLHQKSGVTDCTLTCLQFTTVFRCTGLQQRTASSIPWQEQHLSFLLLRPVWMFP